MPKHAANTKVPVGQSRNEIDKLLRGWCCDGVRWTDRYNKGETVLEFEWVPEGSEFPMLCRFRVELGDPDDAKEAQEWRRMHRVLRVFLMGVFEAVDAGLISLEEAVLPWVVTESGMTVSEGLLPKLLEIPTGNVITLIEG